MNLSRLTTEIHDYNDMKKDVPNLCMRVMDTWKKKYIR